MRDSSRQKGKFGGATVNNGKAKANRSSSGCPILHRSVSALLPPRTPNFSRVKRAGQVKYSSCAHVLWRATICRHRCPLSSKRRRPPPRMGPLATTPPRPRPPPPQPPPHQSASCLHPCRVHPPRKPVRQQPVRRWSSRRRPLRRQPLRRQHRRHRRQSQRTSIPYSPLRLWQSRRPSGCGSPGRAGRRTTPSSLHSSSAPGPPTSRARLSTRLVMWTLRPCGRRL